MTEDDLCALFACPRCDSRLLDQGDRLTCTGCKTVFPKLASVPFLFAEPGVALDEWRSRYHSRLRELEHETAQVAAARESAESDTTTARLDTLHAALEAHRAELTDVLAPLDVTRLTADHSTYLALRTRLPSDQGLDTYYANLHRDWCWGDAENEQSAALLSDALGAPERLLVLGAGGARLAFDLHQAGSHSTVAVDFNPLLLLAARRIMAGEEVALHEFPLAPRDAASVAISRTLRAPGSARDGLHLVLANVLRAPFQPGSFDTVLTPWLTDVLDEPLHRQAARWNRLLAPGGRWIWFGSHTFRSANPADRLSPEESTEIIATQGFSNVTIETAELPYMVSPASRNARREQVVVIRAEKTADIKPPPRHVALPDWLVRSDMPVPGNESFRVQAMSTRIHAFLMALIDGKRSIADMAVLMEEQRLMPRDEAEATLRTFLIRMLEESEGYSTF